MATFHFIRPEWLLGFIPLLVGLFWQYRQTRSSGRWADFCDPELLPFILDNQPGQTQRRVYWGAVLAAVLSILALSGPTWKQLPAPVFRNDAALVIALNLSESMLATDVKPSRLIRARYKIADILKQRKDGQTALLVYAGDAFIVTPLTEDNETILSQLETLAPSLMPIQGNRALPALRLAENLLQQAGLQQGDILLITDGYEASQFNELKPSSQAVRVSVFGVGTQEGAPIQTQGGGFVKDKEGNIWVPKLDIQSLRDLAKQGGGLYQSLTDDDSDIKQWANFFEQVNTSENTDGQNLLLDQWDDMGPWLLILVLPLVALQFRKGILLLLVLPWPEPSQALDWNTLWKNADQQALQAFEQQDYQRAGEQFADPNWKASALYRAGQYQEAAELWKNDTTASGQYNLGNALAQAGQLEDAIKAYDRALQLEPQNQDVLENRQQVEDLLKQQQQQQQNNDSQHSEDSKDQPQDKSESSESETQQSQDSSQDASSESESQNQNSSPQGQESSSDSTTSEADKSQATDSPESKTKEADQASGEFQKDQPDNSQPEANQAAVQEGEGAIDENRQADEQWLNRIVDDPGTLLKRKFKYQYQQRNRR